MKPSIGIVNIQKISTTYFGHNLFEDTFNAINIHDFQLQLHVHICS